MLTRHSGVSLALAGDRIVEFARQSPPLMLPALLVEFDMRTGRRPGRISRSLGLHCRRGHPGAATDADMQAVPRRVRMILAPPAILAEGALHEMPHRRLSYFAAPFYFPSRVLLPSLNFREKQHETDCYDLCHCRPVYFQLVDRDTNFYDSSFCRSSNGRQGQLCGRRMHKGNMST